MNPLSNKILDKIKEQKITPKPKWHFILVHAVLWVSVSIAIILGGMAISLILRSLFIQDWQMVRRIPRGVHAFIAALPYLWIIFNLIILSLAGYLFAHTKKGYRISPKKLILITASISLLLGVFFFFAKADIYVERSLMSHVRPYAKFREMREMTWMSPENGMLVGVVSEVGEPITIIDLKKGAWTVYTTEAEFFHDYEPEVNHMIRVFGEVVSEKTFNAKRIAPSFSPQSRPPRRGLGEGRMKPSYPGFR